jgi:protein SCO1/2
MCFPLPLRDEGNQPKKRTMTRTLLIAIALVALMAQGARAQSYGKAPIPGDPGSHADKKTGFDMKRGNQLPLDLEFFDHTNQPVNLGSLLNGKPAILVMAYYRCPQLCNEVLQSLLESLRVLARGGFEVGRDFNVITVGIDPKETQHMARIKRLAFLKELDGRPEEQTGWWFLTAGHGQGTDVKEADRRIHDLADAVGFWYALRYKGTDYQYDTADGEWKSQSGSKLRADAREYEYIHASGIMIVTPEGKVSQYFMGNSGEKSPDTDDPVGQRPYRARDLRLALVEASGGKIGTAFDQAMLYCFMYDQTTSQYRPVMRTLAWIAAPFVLLVLGIAFLGIRNARRVGNNTLPPLPPASTELNGTGGGSG